MNASARVAKRYSIGDRSLYLEQAGSGSPTIVLEAALGYHSGTWDGIAEPLQAATRVCRYDRAGLGQSDAAPNSWSRTAHDAVDDLAALLVAADVPDPYVLVGHSFGGLISVLYALAHPNSVVGLVLIDAAHPELVSRWKARLTPDEWAPIQADLVDDEADPAELASNPGMDAKGEEIDFMGSTSNPEPLGDLRPIPVTVISSTWTTDDMPPAAVEVWDELQTEYAALSPLGRHIRADTGHFVHREAPALVLDEIRGLLDRTRGNG